MISDALALRGVVRQWMSDEPNAQRRVRLWDDCGEVGVNGTTVLYEQSIFARKSQLWNSR
jgi:hypothetical protein